MTETKDLAARIATAINADERCDREWITARAWTKVAGKERVYLARATGPSRKKTSDAGYYDLSTRRLVDVRTDVAAVVQPVIDSLSVTPAEQDPTPEPWPERGSVEEQRRIEDAAVHDVSLWGRAMNSDF